MSYTKYLNKRIQIFPGDTNNKFGKVTDVLLHSIEVTIDEIGHRNTSEKVGDIIIYPLKSFKFKIV